MPLYSIYKGFPSTTVGRGLGREPSLLAAASSSPSTETLTSRLSSRRPSLPCLVSYDLYCSICLPSWYRAGASMPFLAEATTAVVQTLAERRDPTQRTLHQRNFPLSKAWGCQQAVGSMGEHGEGRGEGEGVGVGGGCRTPEAERGAYNSGIGKMRETLLVHLRKEMGRTEPLVPLPLPYGREHEKEADLESSMPLAPSPWNLRTRRRRARASSVFPRQSSASPPEAGEKRPSRTDRRERPKISVALTSEEIDEDIYAVTGYRARRRPRRRPHVVQKQLDDTTCLYWCLPVSVALMNAWG
ncbi:hypothetical protein ZIOFF_011038 [Zingiber officinale]|uniref:Uncharacterized protein n=1 Tax=Zingiber officinale TaxID=94328 RepID=A0A8J5I564_ZINOF|nr:hypothetical protein ZIOFF_011038 [Zingiber officinale]